MKKEEEITFKILGDGFLILMILCMIFSAVSLFWIPRVYSLEELNRTLYISFYFFLGCILGIFSMIFSLAFFVVKEKEKRRQEEWVEIQQKNSGKK
jgi:acyl-CoA synthetase (AMP-forming)/AMP-acid ligase II